MFGVREVPIKEVTGYPSIKLARNGERGAGQKDNKGDRYGGDEPRTYRMTFPEKSGLRPCPVEGCSGRVVMRKAVQVHLWHHHIRYTGAIMEEGNFLH